MFGYSPYSWKTMPTLRSRGGLVVTSRPSMTIVPESGASRPQIRRRMVVLPPPDGPNRTKNSASAISKLTSSTIALPASSLLRRSTRNPDIASISQRRRTLARHQIEKALGMQQGDHDRHDQHQSTDGDHANDERDRGHEPRDEGLRRVAPDEPQRTAGNGDDVRVRIDGQHRPPVGGAEVPEEAGQRGEGGDERHRWADQDRQPDQEAKDAIERREHSEARRRELAPGEDRQLLAHRLAACRREGQRIEHPGRSEHGRRAIEPHGET